MDRLAKLAATLALSIACAPATAAVTWICGLSEDLVRLVCVAEPDPAVFVAEGAAPVRAVVNGTAFPLDASRRYLVDLWSPPTERAWVELLARATICYRSPGCEVILAWPRETSLARR